MALACSYPQRLFYYRIAGVFCGRNIFANFADLFQFAKILFANILHARARPLALVRGVANVKAIRENFIREIR